MGDGVFTDSSAKYSQSGKNRNGIVCDWFGKQVMARKREKEKNAKKRRKEIKNL